MIHLTDVAKIISINFNLVFFQSRVPQMAERVKQDQNMVKTFTE